MYQEHFGLHHAPFRQEPDPDTYFQGAGHPAILRSLLQDIREGRPLIKLTGKEGVGKTFLNIQLAESLSSETCDIVSLDYPVGSFEDLLRIVCRELSPGGEDISSSRRYILEFRDILAGKQEEGKKVLLIIDEAEKIFLATLERLVRMICDSGGPVLQVLLIGRPELDHNIDQLRIYCSGLDIHTGYILEPLNLSETREYLHYRLRIAGMTDPRAGEVYNDDAAEAIYQATGGNISMINTLADKGLKEAYSRGWNRVDPEMVTPGPGRKKSEQPAASEYLRELARNKWWIGAGIFLVLLVVLALPGKKDDKKGEPSDAGFSVEELVLEKPEIEEPEIPPAESERMAEPAPAEVKEPGPTRQLGPEAAEITPESAVSEPEPEAVEPGREPQITAGGEVEQSGEAPPVMPPEAPGEESRPARVTVQPDNEKEKVPVVVQAEARKKKGPVPGEQEREAEETGPAAEIFQDRLRASSNWLAWSYRNGYTIQLMMLTAEDAEENLKKILVRKEYEPVLGNMYIVRRNAPPALFVFYGLYDTLADARRERDDMPPFLQEHQPYALSIQEALQKVEE
jgi:type II secretory pathway predicted ATPase ExeA/septal ring-binding cell division protein DamX